MLKWIHHLLEPHCKDCREERELAREESKVCLSCETLKSQLATANHEKQQLLNRVLELTTPPKTEVKPTIITPEALKPRSVPWRVRQQMLEEEDRNLAKTLADRQRQVKEAELQQQNVKEQQKLNELEKELGIEQEGVS